MNQNSQYLMFLLSVVSVISISAMFMSFMFFLSLDSENTATTDLLGAAKGGVKGPPDASPDNGTDSGGNTDPTTTTQCNDGKDNDGDGLVDFNGFCRNKKHCFVADPDCSSPDDNTESDPNSCVATTEVCDNKDNDCDGLVDEGDVCAEPEDFCPNDPNKLDDIDSDGDGVLNCNDNCVDDYNPEQIDTDNDGRGDACEIIPVDCNAGKTFNSFPLSNMEKTDQGVYVLNSAMPTFKTVTSTGGFQHYVYPVGSWNGYPVFIGIYGSHVQINNGSIYPVIVGWDDKTAENTPSGHHQRAFVVKMPMSAVENAILPLPVVNGDPKYIPPEENIMAGDKVSSTTFHGHAQIWKDNYWHFTHDDQFNYIPYTSTSTDVYSAIGSSGTNIGWDSYQPSFYIEHGSIAGVIGQNIAVVGSVESSVGTYYTSPYLVRRLLSMIGAQWEEISIQNYDTGECMPLAPLEDTSSMTQPSKTIRNQVLYDEIIASNRVVLLPS